MYIKKLELKNYRNYKELELSFHEGTNIFYGENAQGKTNILESMFLCGTTKSHRGSKDKEIIRFGEEESHIRMYVDKNHVEHKIDMHLRSHRSKGVAIDGIPIRKASELFGLVNFVFFSPEDLNIIKNGPAERRKFSDSEMCQLNRVFMMDLISYNKILVQRNKLLKDLAFQPSLEETLDVWDMQLVQYGKKIIRERKLFFEKLNRIIAPIHEQLTGNRESIEIVYEPDTEEERLEEEVFLSRDRDKKIKTSNVGPHRDDFCVNVNGMDMRKYGSQGQQRSAALSLKLSEISMIRENSGHIPILLLDDVLSELDQNRQTYLLNNIRDIQTFITCTGMDDFIRNSFPVHRKFHVIEGTVSE